MFKSKSKTEKAREKAGKKLGTVKHRSQKQAVKQAGKATKQAGKAATQVVHVADSANTAFRERVAPVAVGAALTAREKAMLGIDHGVDAAAPRLEHAVAGVAPKVDHARDMIVEDLLPRIQDMLTHVVEAKDDALSRRDGAVAMVTGAPKKKKRRKGTLLIVLGVLAAAGAGVAAYLNSQQRSQDDPWARPAEPVDRPVGAPGVDAEVGASGTPTEAPGAGATMAGTAGAGATVGATTGQGQPSSAPPAVDDADSAGALSDDPSNDIGSTQGGTNTPVTGPDVDDTTGFGGPGRP